jgi:N-methylhydantoinase A
MIKIAIDTGGTFTDYTAVGSFGSRTDGKLFVKNPTNHERPAEGIMEGLQKLAGEWETDLKTLLSETEKITLGTTLALNALLEKKGVKTALFTTEGFRDALEIRRSQLKNQWDLAVEKPMVLVPRRLRLGIEGRLDYQGDVVTPLNEDKVREACQKCREQGVLSIAVCYLFSFLNPEHERRTAEIIKEELPDVFVSLSADVAPRIREYERTTTTVINAYLTPVLADYLGAIKKELARYGFKKPIHIMMNNGGLSDTDAMATFAVKTLLSGPAGGAVGNETIGRLLGKTDTVLADMGGTSFDIHVVSGSSNQLVPQTELAGYPLSIPMIDISSIGAGGGSIAHVEVGGRVFIGPDSAGSVPGPACYNLGGEEPTVTDALLLLGLINADNFLGGKLALSRAKAEQAVREKVAEPLNVSVLEAARIIYGIAAEMMDSLHMPEVLIPVQGPVFCSWGMLGAASRYDVTRSFFMEKSQWDAQRINQTLALMRQEGERELERLNVAKDQRRFDLILEMRYVSQHHEISVPWTHGAFDPDSWKSVETEFYNTHEAIYEYAQRDKDWEIIDLHLACCEENGQNVLFPMGSPKSAAVTKPVSGYAFNRDGEITVPVYNEGDLHEKIAGPALVDFAYTTLVIPENFFCTMADEGILALRKVVD